MVGWRRSGCMARRCWMCLAGRMSLMNSEVAPEAMDTLHVGWRLAELAVLRRQADAPQSQLGGYPHWVGASSWPECHWCGGQMYLLAQFVAATPLEPIWGMRRRGYLFCCAEPCDPEALTLILQG